MSFARIALLLVVACIQPKPGSPPPSNEATGSAQVAATVAAPAGTEAAAFERARAEHKGVAVELYAAWATPSVDLEEAMRDPSVAGPLAASFVLLRIDVTANTDADMVLRERYAAKTLPAVVFLAPDGSVLGRVTTTLDPPELAEMVKAAAARLPR
jgi:thiol:disulfide interchange protein